MTTVLQASKKHGLSVTAIRKIIQDAELEKIKVKRNHYYSEEEINKSVAIYRRPIAIEDGWVPRELIDQHYGEKSLKKFLGRKNKYRLQLGYTSRFGNKRSYRVTDVETVLSIGESVTIEHLSDILLTSEEAINERAGELGIYVGDSLLSNEHFHKFLDLKKIRVAHVTKITKIGTLKTKLEEIIHIDGTVFSILNKKEFIFRDNDGEHYDCRLYTSNDLPENINDVISMDGGYAKDTRLNGNESPGLLYVFHATKINFKNQERLE